MIIIIGNFDHTYSKHMFCTVKKSRYNYRLMTSASTQLDKTVKFHSSVEFYQINWKVSYRNSSDRLVG